MKVYGMMRVESITSQGGEMLQDRLNRVVRLRLFRNTNRELSEYIGYKLESNNSITRIPPFAARCIFHELCREVQEQLAQEVDLEQWLVAYDTASAFFKLHICGRKRVLCEEDLFILLNYMYTDGCSLPVEKRYLHKLAAAITEQEIDVPILLLLMLDVLPSYISKKGNVKDVLGDFYRVYRFLRAFVARHSLFDEFPVLERFEKQVREGVYCNRLFLIYVTAVTLNTFECYANPRKLYALSADTDSIKLFLDVDNAIWVEPAMCAAPSVFWRFEFLDTNDYFLYRYAVNTEKRKLVYVRYEVTFVHDEKDGVLLMVNSFDSVPLLIEGKPLPGGMLSVFACMFDNLTLPCSVELRSLVSGNTDFSVRKLVRLTDEGQSSQLMRWLDGKERYVTRNKYPEQDYTLLPSSLAITNDSIYVKDDSVSTAEHPVYYRVPKKLNSGLEDITITDSVGILTFSNRKYIEFVPLLLFFDITNRVLCEENGISLVDSVVF